jgi:hypothetical protein
MAAMNFWPPHARPRHFIENTPITLILSPWSNDRQGQLVAVRRGRPVHAGACAHVLGMDGGKLKVGRMVGTLTAMLTQVGWPALRSGWRCRCIEIPWGSRHP